MRRVAMTRTHVDIKYYFDDELVAVLKRVKDIEKFTLSNTKGTDRDRLMSALKKLENDIDDVRKILGD